MNLTVRLILLAIVVVPFMAGADVASSAAVTVGVYPSGTTLGPTSAAPPRPAASASLAMPSGGVDDAAILVRGAKKVAIQSPTLAEPLKLRLLFARYIKVQRRLVPDALEPWNGSERVTQTTNQPIWLQVTVPDDTAPKTYSGSVQVVADGGARVTTVPISVRVFPVRLPRPDQVFGSLLTAFNLSPQSYANKAASLYGVKPESTLPGLFSFFASYRLSPNNWGYGNPTARHGYTSDKRAGAWWLHKKERMIEAVGKPRRFASMWIPVSNNRWSPSTYVGGGLSPFKPGTWCPYLRSVRRFWQEHGWLRSPYPYTWGMDEPGLPRLRIVQQQAKVTHDCFAGSKVIVTGRPTKENRFLWNGGKDDVDAWVVLPPRYYGKFTTPAERRRRISRARQNLRLINAARRRGKQIWAYTYGSAAHSTPSFTATEPVADPRLLVDWAALERISGLLYGQGTTTYGKGNPLFSNDREAGSFVLVYPGREGPIPSARLEVLREGIEDWEILNVVRRKRGAARVRRLLAPLFSTTSSGVKLACSVGCPIKARHAYSWPKYSRDATTARKIAAMRLQALMAAG